MLICHHVYSHNMFIHQTTNHPDLLQVGLLHPAVDHLQVLDVGDDVIELVTCRRVSLTVMPGQDPPMPPSVSSGRSPGRLTARRLAYLCMFRMASLMLEINSLPRKELSTTPYIFSLKGDTSS